MEGGRNIFKFRGGKKKKNHIRLQGFGDPGYCGGDDVHY